MNEHHLKLGQLEDFLTARLIDDTHDERYRQKIARWLVFEKGYTKTEITAQAQIWVKAGGKCSQVPVALTVHLGTQIALIVHYGPGSLVTRHRPALALARLVAPYQVPVVVVTNGEQADILDGATGQIRATGFEGIPHKDQLVEFFQNCPQDPIPAHRVQMEARIVMAFEVDDRCPCDTSICKLEAQEP